VLPLARDPVFDFFAQHPQGHRSIFEHQIVEGADVEGRAESPFCLFAQVLVRIRQARANRWERRMRRLLASEVCSIAVSIDSQY
jgi:hypothetical protein